MPVDGDMVTIDYEGNLLDGTVFDSSFARGGPISGPVGRFAPGFTDALKAMRPGRSGWFGPRRRWAMAPR